MKIRILQSIVTTSQAFKPGDVVEVDKKIGKSWIMSGIAEEDKSLEGAPEVKEEVDSKVDNTTNNRASKSRRGKGVPKS